MQIRFAVYNMEWMKDLFHRDGTPKTTQEPDAEDRRDGERSAKLAAVVRALAPDLLCVVEGPDTLADGSKTASGQLEAWAAHHQLEPSYRGVHGFASGGQQELCALFRSDKLAVRHAPERAAAKHPFNEPFLVDTAATLIKEQYKHYRPPLELSIGEPGAGGDELARVIVAHTKSKGIFDMVDFARFEQLSERNRKKLYAECYSIRERCDQWLEETPGLKLIVCGDINDGFGLDHYEQRFSRSAVEILLGDVWEPDRILTHALPRPRLRRHGWVPSSSDYVDRLTGDRVNVLIDHVIVSRATPVANARVWNPFPRDAPAEVRALRDELKDGADHFPVSCDLDL